MFYFEFGKYSYIVTLKVNESWAYVHFMKQGIMFFHDNLL